MKESPGSASPRDDISLGFLGMSLTVAANAELNKTFNVLWGPPDG